MDNIECFRYQCQRTSWQPYSFAGSSEPLFQDVARQFLGIAAALGSSLTAQLSVVLLELDC